jgi:tetratricopeptide (TPR) repeat protein
MSRKAKRERREAKVRVREAPVVAQTRPPDWVIPAAIALITIVAFVPVLQAQFVAFDDPENFLLNQRYRGLGLDQLRWMWTTTHLGHYVPLSWMTLGLDYLLYGMNPAGYHATNLLLHAANAVLVYFVGRRLLGGDSVVGAAVAALAFAIHPLRVESVAWVTERRDMLSLMFSLTSVLLYLRALGTTPRFRRLYIWSLVAYACALLSKATAVTVPASLLVMNVFPLRRIGGERGWWSPEARRAYVEIIPYAMAAVLCSMLTLLALQPGVQLPWGQKLAVSAYGLAFYLYKTVAPLGLAALYESRADLNLLAWPFVASYVAVLVLAIFCWFARKRWPGVVAALIAFTLSVLPLLGVVQNGPQLAADRYTYHAAPALALVLGGAAMVAQSRKVATLAAAAALVCLGVLTFRQTHVWRDSEALWGRVLELDSASYLANNNLGVVLAEQGRVEEAIAHYRRSIATRDSYAYSHNNLGYELAGRGDVEAAIAEYRKALAINPSFAEAHVNLGNALLARRELDQAVAHYAEAARLEPGRAGIQFNWGVALREKGDLSGAIDHYRQALEIDSQLLDAQRELVDALREIRSGTEGVRTR